jgi:hypothetical protein
LISGDLDEMEYKLSTMACKIFDAVILVRFSFAAKSHDTKATPPLPEMQPEMFT